MPLHHHAERRQLQAVVGRAVAIVYILMYTYGVPRQYSIADARSSLPRIIDQAEAGLEVELTRRGRPVAVVVSRRTFDRLRDKRRQFGEAYQRFLEQFSLDEIGLDQGELATARDTTAGRRVTL